MTADALPEGLNVEVQRLRLRPGDTLVLRLARPPSPRQTARARDLARTFGCEVLILDNDADVEVLTRQRGDSGGEAS